MTAATGGSGGSWKYRFGLLLILAVVLIWVGSAEVTQLIFEKYRHPFLLTWLGASLLTFYLPVAYLRECMTPYWSRYASGTPRGAGAMNKLKERDRAKDSVLVTADSVGPSGSSGSVSRVKSPHKGQPAKELELPVVSKPAGSSGKAHGSVGHHPLAGPSRGKGLHSPKRLEEDEENAPLLQTNGEADQHKHGVQETLLLSTKEVLGVALLLAPLWLLTEYLSNASLSMTSVSSTTILSSTSGLFTLLFGVTVGGEQFTTGKILAALVSIAGVIMTELGKSSAADDQQVFGDTDRNPGEGSGQYGLPDHNLVGDMLGLLSAVSYGFYTTLLRKYVGGEGGGEEKADLQKVFGYIGLFTLVGLWWLVFPLYLIGWEPVPVMPSTYGLDEDILANGLIGSMISDYFWAVSVVWTTPLVATLGLSLTIPLAMLADMVMHSRAYSLVYILGACGVFAGFLVANLGDDCRVTQFSDSWLGQKISAHCSCCVPAWWRRQAGTPAAHAGIDGDGDSVLSDKEND